MLDIDKSLPNDPDELRQFMALLLAEVKSQAVLIEKLRHQLAMMIALSAVVARRLGEDVTEELEYVPGRFIVNRIVRPRFA